MIPEKKIEELSVLAHPNIVIPETILYDERNVAIGYTMKYLKNTYVLCQIFTKSFRLRNNISQEKVVNLILPFRELVQFVHDKDRLIVDLNELNFLLDNSFSTIYAIDVNGYSTPSYPSLAIMDTIRDRHCHGNFSKETDWFSYAILTFQMLVGIHPFRGNHDTYKTMDERMKHNVSILNPTVRYPKGVCQPFDSIPSAFLEWYLAVFDNGQRVHPPKSLQAKAAPVQQITQVVGSNVFEIHEIASFPSEIIGYYENLGREVYVTNRGVYIDRVHYNLPGTNIKIGFTPTGNRPIAAYIVHDEVFLHDLLGGKEYKFSSNGTDLLSYEGRLYLLNARSVIEIVLLEMGDGILPSPIQVGNILKQTTQVFDGVIIQNLFDAHYASIFPSSRNCRQIALRELDDYKVIDAKFDTKVLMVTAFSRKSLKYDRFVFRFNANWDAYDVRVVNDISHTGINFTVLKTGICVEINEEEAVEIFVAKKDAPGIKQIKDPVIDGDMILYHRQATALFAQGKKMYSISVRK
jgi:hypothetical protein